MARSSDCLVGAAVLVADDFPALTSLVAEVFRACRARVFTASSGQEAMMTLQLEHLDLVVLDLHMPPPDGWQVLQFIRQVCPDLLARTILLTADAYRQETLLRIRSAALPVVYKPFEVATLQRVARETLSRARHAPPLTRPA